MQQQRRKRRVIRHLDRQFISGQQDVSGARLKAKLQSSQNTLDLTLGHKSPAAPTTELTCCIMATARDGPNPAAYDAGSRGELARKTPSGYGLLLGKLGRAPRLRGKRFGLCFRYKEDDVIHRWKEGATMARTLKRQADPSHRACCRAACYQWVATTPVRGRPA